MMKVTYKLNPMFVVMVVFFAGVGYLIGETRGAVWGMVIMFGISFLVGLIDAIVNAGKSDVERALDELRRQNRK